jgi:hydroxyacylglutathione hydrolase
MYNSIRKEPIFMKDFTYERLEEGLTRIDAPTVNEAIYLLEGKNEAYLIDTGYGVCSLLKTVKNLTSLPVTVINTHGHPDHGGGNGEFEKAFMNPIDFKLYKKTCRNFIRKFAISKMLQVNKDREKPNLKTDFIKYKYNLLPLEEGHVFDLGNRKLKVIYTPGHTPGSICLYDDEHGDLFAGDTLASREEWLFLPSSTTVEKYLQTLQKIKAACPNVKRILCGHSPSPVSGEIIDDYISCCEEVLTGNNLGETKKTFLGKKKAIKCGKIELIYTPSKIS